MGRKKTQKKRIITVPSVTPPGSLEITTPTHLDPWADVCKVVHGDPTQLNTAVNICKARVLAHAADKRSRWTKGHSERVTFYAVAIGKKMGLPNKDIETLKIAGLMHDIGRTGTYDALLDKPVGITEEEFELIKKHPARGAEIIKPISQLHGVSTAVKHHHERIDGKGYPDNLTGDVIPLSARIICVADSFDSISTDRPYRPRRRKEDALAELHIHAGRQFDPEIVQAFQSVFRETGARYSSKWESGDIL